MNCVTILDSAFLCQCLCKLDILKVKKLKMIYKPVQIDKKQNSNNRLLKSFVKTIKQNTFALKELKLSIDKNNVQNDSNKIFELTNSVNEKLEIVHKLRNDIKIYRTINTVLTNHYIKETRDHENTIDNKIIKLQAQIKQSYDELKAMISKMADSKCVASDKISAPIKNSNIFLVGNDLKYNQIKEFKFKTEIYNNILKKIDKLFGGMVSFRLYSLWQYLEVFCLQKNVLNII